MSESTKPVRTIRSFVRREGRITAAQTRALEQLLPRYGVTAGQTPLDLAAIFGRAAPVHLEIGFGNGEALAAMAGAQPENNYLGIEVHRPGVGMLLRTLDAGAVTNVRILCADAREVLERCIPDGSLSGVYIFFPDPWPKKRHHKRRLVQLEFVTLVQRKLLVDGLLHLATDWEDYAQQMLAVLSSVDGLENTAPSGRGVSRPPARPLTRFERRGHRLGHGVWDLIFRRTR